MKHFIVMSTAYKTSTVKDEKISIAVRIVFNILSYNWNQTRIIKNGKRRKNYKEIKSRTNRESSEIFRLFTGQIKIFISSPKRNPC